MRGIIPKICKPLSGDTVKASDKQRVTEYLVQTAINKKFPIEKNTQQFFNLVFKKLKGLPTNTLVTENELDSILEKQLKIFNKTAKKRLKPHPYKKIFKIHLMLGSNEILLKSFLDNYTGKILPVKSAKLTKEERALGATIVPLDRAPLSTINSLYAQMEQTYNAKGERYFKGFTGNLRLMFNKGTRIKDFDPTGGLTKVMAATEAYVSKVSGHVAKWLGVENDSGNIVSGMSQIYNDIKKNIKSDLNDDDQFRMTQLFNMIMHNWTYIEHSYIDKKGNKVIVDAKKLYSLSPDKKAKFIKDNNIKSSVMIHSNYEPIVDPKEKFNPEFYYYDKENKVWRYKLTKDIVYNYSKPISMKDYINGKSLNSSQKQDLKDKIYLDDSVRFVLNAKDLYDNLLTNNLSQDNLIKMGESVDKARNIHSKVFQDLKRRFELLKQNYIKEIHKWIPNTRNNEKYLNIIIDAVKTGNINPYTNKEIFDEDYDSILFLKDTFGGLIFTDPYLTGESTILEKKDSFPIEYDSTSMFYMYQNLLYDKEQDLKGINEALKTATKREVRISLNNSKKKVEASIRKIQRNQAMFNDQDIDLFSGKTNYSPRNAVNFRNISNAFDIRNMKLGENIYENYLKRMYQTLEKSNLAVEIMGGVRLSGTDKTNRFNTSTNPITVDYALEQMKAVLSSPDIKGNFFGYNLSNSNIIRAIYEKTGIKINEWKASKYNRILSSFFTGGYLGGISTAVLQRSVILNKKIAFGWNSTRKAREVYNNYRKEINEFVAATGVTDWTDYFSSELFGDLAQIEVTTREEAIKITQYTLEYHNDLSKGMNKDVAFKKLTNKITNIVKQVPGVKKLLETSIKNILKDPDLPANLKAKLKADKENKLLHIVNNYANWAITRNFSSYPITKDINIVQKALRKKTQFYAWLSRSVKDQAPAVIDFITMSEQEKDMRSQTVIITMQMMQDSGMLLINNRENGLDIFDALRKKRNNELTTEELDILNKDLELIIKVARQQVAQIDMMMTTSTLGQYNRNFGGLHTRFTTYTQQKFGSEVTLFREYYRSLDIKTKNGLHGKEVLRLIRLLYEDFKDILKPTLSLTSKSRQRKIEALWEKNPELAKLRLFILTQGIATALFEFGFFTALGPGLRSILYGLGSPINPMKLVQGIKSSIGSALALPAYLIYAYFNDDDEEDVMEEAAWALKSNPIVGYGTGESFDMMLYLMKLINNEDEEKQAQDLVNRITPLLPLQGPERIAFRYIGSPAIVNAIKDD